MDRYWLLTNTTYGTWLPGDHRGFVGHVLEHRPIEPDEDRRILHNIPGTPCDVDLPGLETAAALSMKGPPIHLTLQHAESALAQFQETARFRNWQLEAVAIMFRWTERGSTRKLSNEMALRAAIQYVLYNQPDPLLTWSPELGLNPHRRHMVR